MSEYPRKEFDPQFSEVCTTLMIDETFPKDLLLIESYKSWEDYVESTLGTFSEEQVYLKKIYTSLTGKQVGKDDVIWDERRLNSLRLRTLKYIIGDAVENPRERLVDENEADYNYLISEIYSKADYIPGQELGIISFIPKPGGMEFVIKDKEGTVKLSSTENAAIRYLINDVCGEGLKDIILYDFYYSRLKKRVELIQDHVLGQMLAHCNTQLTNTLMTALFRGAKQSGIPMVLARYYQTPRGQECDVFGFEVDEKNKKVIRSDKHGDESYVVGLIKGQTNLSAVQPNTSRTSTIDRLRGSLVTDIPTVTVADLEGYDRGVRSDFARNFYRITKNAQFLNWSDIDGDDWNWMLSFLNMNGSSVYELR